MAKRFTSILMDDIQTVTFHQRPTFGELSGSLQQVQNAEHISLVVWDFSEADFNIGYDDVHTIAEAANSTLKPPMIMAIIAPSDLSFGVARMFQSMLDESQADIIVVRSLQAAGKQLAQRSASKKPRPDTPSGPGTLLPSH